MDNKDFEASLKLDKAFASILSGQKEFGEKKLEMDQVMFDADNTLNKCENWAYKTETKMSNIHSEWSNLTKEIR